MGQGDVCCTLNSKKKRSELSFRKILQEARCACATVSPPPRPSTSSISRSLLGEIVSQHLGYHKICARPHTAASTRELLDQFGWEIFDHPPYSPDLAPSDFHLFTKLKDFLGGTRFGSDEELKTVNTWLNELAAEEYNTGILKLVNRYDKCLNVGGDYVEKEEHLSRPEVEVCYLAESSWTLVRDATKIPIQCSYTLEDRRAMLLTAKAVNPLLRSEYSFAAKSKELAIPLQQATKRAAFYTGVGVTTIKKIRKESKERNEMCPDDPLSTPGKTRIQPQHNRMIVDDFDRCVIKNIINEFYVREKKVPTVPTLLPIIRSKITFPWGCRSLNRLLRVMGYKWKKCQSKRKILLERADIVSWRHKYLTRIKHFREAGCNIGRKLG
ncbi:hypothetical protein ANN_25833 [Periplaneta americana]|uniref:Histone-lysine N-methyltransferase SETMAR n=1 Tax=Periplaneta americana TaxID=6978 RepID=A0ABQ8S4S9_PERAM|nr:hypothetical protein ANN_25833 [Periplaneta americana]